MDNLFNHDPTHIFWAKYYVNQTVLSGKNGEKYYWEEYAPFRCKPVQPRSTAFKTMNNNLQAAAPDTVLLETRWAGIEYKVNDYVEYRGLKYIIQSVKKDETLVNPQVLFWSRNNPNTYYTLELAQVDIIDKNL